MYKQRKESFVEKFSTLTEAVAEKDIENKMIEEEMKKERKQMEEVAVLNDLARLEVRRLRDLLSAKSDAVFSLENRKQQLLLSMEERKQEINVHRDLLKAELKVLDDDKHKVTMELRERQANVVRLKARFEAVARGEDEGHSQAYYIIKAAQKREELQRKGDQLDQAVRKCEREIRALQTTLDHLNARNKAYRESFQKVDMKGSDAEILKQMEDRTKMNKESLFRKKKELQRLATDLEEDTRRFEQLDQQNNKAVQQKEHLESARNQIQEEIEVQEKQSDELVTKMTKALEKHRKS
jgi:chromosome segregation ATPase